MTLARIAAIATAAAITFTAGAITAPPDTADAGNPPDITECTYNSVIADPDGECARQIVYVDADFLKDADTYTGTLVLPGGLWSAECAHLNAWQTACVVGDFICSEIVHTASHGTVCHIPTPTPTPTPTPDPGPAPATIPPIAVPVFTG